MKLCLIVLLALVAIAASQPIDESQPAAAVSNVDVAVMKFIESDDDEVHDMEGSELVLKLIQKKIAKLTAKCYKLGGCGAHHGYAAPYPGYGAGYY